MQQMSSVPQSHSNSRSGASDQAGAHVAHTRERLDNAEEVCQHPKVSANNAGPDPFERPELLLLSDECLRRVGTGAPAA